MEMRTASESVLIGNLGEDSYRRLRERERAARRRQNETPEQALLRRQKERERTARRRRNEDPIQTALRRLQDRKRKAKRIRNESLEEKLLRRERDRERKARSRQNQRERGVQRRRRERERTGQRRRKLIPPSCSEMSGVYTNNTTQQFQLQFTKKDNEKAELLTQDYPNKSKVTTRAKLASETLSSADSLFQHFHLTEPTDVELQIKQERRFGNEFLEERRQMAFTESTLMDALPLPARTPMQVPQHLQVASSPPAQPAPRQGQVLAPPVQVTVGKSRPIEKPRPREKRLLAVANHQRGVMSSLASLWRSGKLCDAGIGNGSSTVKVHKVVLSAVCPKLLSVFSADMFSHKFMQVNFPGEVSKEALKAFAEYMYNGLLNLDCDILEQLKIIANKLDMKEFEQLCDSHLPVHMQQPASAGANVPFNQTTLPIPAMTSSLASAIPPSMQSSPSTTPEVIDIKQEISEDDLAQVLFGQESEVASLSANKSGNAAGSDVGLSIKTEPVGPEDDKYGHWSGSSSNQAFTSTTSSSLSSSIAVAATTSTSIVSVPASSTEFAIPFSEGADVKSTKLKAPHSYEAPFVSDSYPVSGIVEKLGSQSNHMSVESSKTSIRPSVTMSSIGGPSRSTSNEGVYPVELFTAGGDNLPLLTTQSVDGKTIDLYKTDST